MAITIRPGLLVSLKTSVKGGVEYERVDLDTGKRAERGAKVSRWETTKTVLDPVEYEAARKLQSKARNIISRVCIKSEFGLLCPLANEEKLAKAVEEARDRTRVFNADSKLSTVGVYVITGRVAGDDAEAMRALSQELTGLFEAMERGVKAADPQAIRQAAAKAKGIGRMLSPDAAKTVNEAVKQARSAASVIVKRVEKLGEDAAIVAEEVKIAAVKAARFAFLDMDEEKPSEAVQRPAPAVDLAAEELPAPPVAPRPAREVEVEASPVATEPVKASPALAALSAWDLA